MTSQKVPIQSLIDHIKTAIDVDPWAKEMVEELLKEQEPVKPCVTVDTWICPKCGHALESQSLIDDKENSQVLVHELYSFCPNCGRSVNWE